MARYKIHIVIMASSILALLAAQNVFAQIDFSGVRGCEYIWKQGILGEMIGVNSFYTGDIDNDGITEIICSAESRPYHKSSFWYILEYDEQQSDYRQVWISDGYPEETGMITAIDVVDVGFKGEKKICVAISTGLIEVFNATTLQRESYISIPNDVEDREITTILAADADNDNQLELVCCTMESTFIFKTPGYTLEHQLDYGSTDLKCGNVDSSTMSELIYDNGYVICLTPADTEPQLIAYFNTPAPWWGLITLIEIKDIDGDQMLELIHVINNNLYVWDVDLKRLKFSKTFDDDLWGVVVADSNGDGDQEIIVAEVYHSNIIICMNTAGDELWRLTGHNGSGVAGIEIGDFDNDNHQEIMWISGSRTTEDDYFHVYSLMPDRHLEWKSTYTEPPYVALKVGDVDGDGREEIVTLRTNDGILSVFDALTHQPEWVSEEYWGDPYDFEIFDIDNDGEMEIILCGRFIRVIDGTTHELESSHSLQDIWGYRLLEIADIDNNGMFEYIITDGYNTIIIDPTDYGILWDSRNKRNAMPDDRSELKFVDFMTGNVDDDPEIEILINSNGTLTCYDVVNHQEFTMTVEENSSACLFDRDKNGIMEIYLCDPEGSFGFIDARTQTYTALPYTIDKNVNEIKIFNPSLGEDPVMAFLYDDKLRFFDFGGRMSIPKVTGEYHSTGIEVFDTSNDGIAEIFVISYNMVTEYSSDCFIPLGEPDNKIPIAYRAYPNPTQNLFHLELNSKTTKDAFATLFSLQGKQLAKFHLVGGINEIDMTSYPSGLYLLNVNTAKESFSIKVIRE